MAEPFIRLEGVSKSFGTLHVLRDISLSLNQGEITSIVGPSGAGKTTLLQIVGTLLAPDKGRLLVQGVDPFRLSAARQAEFRNRQMGFVFQFHQLLPEFTAEENVAIPAMIAGRSRREALEEARRLLTRLGLAERSSHKPAELSGGEKQRIAVARALINRPALILADEPSGSLDSVRKEELLALFLSLRDELGQTFLIVTHDPDFALRADRCVSLQDGAIVSDVTSDSRSLG